MLLRSPCGICQACNGPVCAACAAELRAAGSLAAPLHLDVCVAALDYDAARSLITSLKNGQRRDVAGWLAGRITELVRPPAGALVTWAPTTAPRRRSRGFDQAELLARASARRWDLACRPLLRRTGAASQAGRTAQERRSNPSFAATRSVPPVVVVVDDVVTTGSTLTAAARALRAAGAVTVVGAVAARSDGAPGRRQPVG